MKTKIKGAVCIWFVTTTLAIATVSSLYVFDSSFKESLNNHTSNTDKPKS